jgi:Tol biopolymer transport system component
MRRIPPLALAIIISACSGSDHVTDPRPWSPTGSRPAWNVAVCEAATFGPRTFTRGAGEPISETFSISANPQAEYVLDVSDNDSRGANASVILNGVEQVPSGLDGSRRFDVHRSVTLGAQNTLVVRLTGATGSTLTVAISCTSTPPQPAAEIVFQSTRDGNEEIYSMHADGSNQVRLTNHPAVDFEPSWSPNRDKVAWVSSRAGGFQIFTMNADGSNVTQLTTGSINRAPQWSPDGSTIVFYSDRNGFHQVFAMNADGQNQRLIVEFWSYDPVWSPDGARIAFSGDAATGGAMQDIWVANADGSNRTRLTIDPAIDYTPSWSPDGSRIAFSSERAGGVEDVYVMQANGSDQIRLTNDPSEDFQPWWSPDGNRLIFASRRMGRFQLFVMDATGAGQTMLTTASGDNYGPNWK